MICPRCLGDGTLIVWKVSRPDVRCGMCNGDGYIDEEMETAVTIEEAIALLSYEDQDGRAGGGS